MPCYAMLERLACGRRRTISLYSEGSSPSGEMITGPLGIAAPSWVSECR